MSYLTGIGGALVKLLFLEIDFGWDRLAPLSGIPFLTATEKKNTRTKQLLCPLRLTACNRWRIFHLRSHFLPNRCHCFCINLIRRGGTIANGLKKSKFRLTSIMFPALYLWYSSPATRTSVCCKSPRSLNLTAWRGLSYMSSQCLLKALVV